MQLYMNLVFSGDFLYVLKLYESDCVRAEVEIYWD